MSTSHHNLNETGALPVVNPYWRIAIVRAEWNGEITQRLLDGCLYLLHQSGVQPHQIHVHHVPGSFELPLGAQWALEKCQVSAVICLGAVIRGETAHFDYVCQAVSSGIKDVGLKFSLPVIFGVLTDDTMEQSIARSGGALGNKGIEAAATALKMLHLMQTIGSRSAY